MTKTKSKVKSVQANGTWEHKEHGTFYKFEYEMNDGTVISANHKNKEPFAGGTEVEYEIKGNNDHGNYGKVSKPKPELNGYKGKSFEADPKKQVAIVAQSSMTKAIDILLSGIVPIEFISTKDFVDKTEALTDLLMKKQIQLTKKHTETFKAI